MKAYHTLIKFVLLSSVTDISAAASEECSASIDLNKSSYGHGEDIAVTLKQCHTDKEDFVAIYDASVDLNDINGAVNYRLWMRACGSQYCSVETTESGFSFGEVNNKHTWPLPIGKYRAHLVKKDVSHQFSSSASSPIFTVESLPKEQAEKFFNIEVSRNLKATHQDCINSLATTSTCYEAGDIIAMKMTSECTQVSHSDWIGIYNDEPNKDDMYFGEPSVWMRVCHEDDCHQLTSATYHSNLSHHKELQGGNYRLALVRKGYDHEGPYKAQLVSESFQVRKSNEKCEIKAEDTTL
jgi:hypothetical protein